MRVGSISDLIDSIYGCVDGCIESQCIVGSEQVVVNGTRHSNTLYAMFLFKYRSTTKCAITTNSHKACTPANFICSNAFACLLWYENAHFVQISKWCRHADDITDLV